MYRWLFTGPVFAAVVLLLLHSWFYRGPRKTLLFWGVGYVFAFGREWLYQNFFPTYRFAGDALRIAHVPVTIPMGWLFEAYISLHLAQVILGIDMDSLTGGQRKITPEGYGRRVLPLIGLAALISGAIAIAMEVAGTSMGWWVSFSQADLPLGLPSQWTSGDRFANGHIYTVFWLLTLLIYLTHEPLRLARNLVHVLFMIIMFIIAEQSDKLMAAAGEGLWLTSLVMLGLGGFFGTLFLYRMLPVYFLALLAFIMSGAPGQPVANLFGLGYSGCMFLETVFNEGFLLLLMGALISTRQSGLRRSPLELL
jgi:hypothetical protein